MNRPVETSGFAISASDFSWRKSAWSVFVFACASCTLRMTSSSESAFGALAANADDASAATPITTAKSFLLDTDCNMGCPTASPQSRRLRLALGHGLHQGPPHRPPPELCFGESGLYSAETEVIDEKELA